MPGLQRLSDFFVSKPASDLIISYFIYRHIGYIDRSYLIQQRYVWLCLCVCIYICVCVCSVGGWPLKLKASVWPGVRAFCEDFKMKLMTEQRGKTMRFMSFVSLAFLWPYAGNYSQKGCRLFKVFFEADAFGQIRLHPQNTIYTEKCIQIHS